MSDPTRKEGAQSQPGNRTGRRPDRLTKQLESLRRKHSKNRRQSLSREPSAPQPGQPRSGSPGILYRRDVPRTGPPPSAYTPPSGRCLDLAQAVAGREARARGGRPYYLVDSELQDLHPELGSRLTPDSLLLGRAGPDSGLRSPVAEELCELCNGSSPPMETVTFLDLETTGLASSPLFLIGTLVAEGDGLLIRQYLARSYAEEYNVISAFAEEVASKRLLVSFNGKSFDVPYLRARAAANLISLPELPAHLDLLHAARRAYRPVLPDCRLQTLERFVCRRWRVEDIPGEQIPEAYHYFVRTGNAVDLAQILKHNAQDLVTLLELFGRMLGCF